MRYFVTRELGYTLERLQTSTLSSAATQGRPREATATSWLEEKSRENCDPARRRIAGILLLTVRAGPRHRRLVIRGSLHALAAGRWPDGPGEWLNFHRVRSRNPLEHSNVARTAGPCGQHASTSTSAARAGDPGGIRTPCQTKLWHNPEEEARMLGQQCLKERIEPEHVAAMVLFLASDDARMCTAHGYFVDAGWR
jgi:hypothetical protein